MKRSRFSDSAGRSRVVREPGGGPGRRGPHASEQPDANWFGGTLTLRRALHRYRVSLGMAKKLLQQRRRTGEIGARHHHSGRKPIDSGDPSASDARPAGQEA